MSKSDHDARIQREYVDWYVISKRSIYISTSILLAIIILVLAYIWRPKHSEQEDLGLHIEGPRLVLANGKVVVRRAESGYLIPGTTGMVLYPGDTIQTSSEAAAMLQYIDNTTLRIRPDSTVVVKESSIIRKNAKDISTDTTNITNQLMSGTVNVSTITANQGGTNTLIAKDVKINFPFGSQGTVGNNNEKVQIVVEKGTLLTTDRQGQTQNLAQNTSTDFVGGIKIEQITLPSPPQVKAPINAAIFSFENGTQPEITFSWMPVSPSAKYRLQISNSQSFLSNDILLDTVVLNPFFAWQGKSADGTYYWKVQAILHNGQEGIWSDEQRLSLVFRQVIKSATSIRIDPPQVIRYGTLIEISGTTEPGVQLHANGKFTVVDNTGKYITTIELPNGQHTVTLLAEDITGRKGRKIVSVK